MNSMRQNMIALDRAIAKGPVRGHVRTPPDAWGAEMWDTWASEALSEERRLADYAERLTRGAYDWIEPTIAAHQNAQRAWLMQVIHLIAWGLK